MIPVMKHSKCSYDTGIDITTKLSSKLGLPLRQPQDSNSELTGL